MPSPIARFVGPLAREFQFGHGSGHYRRDDPGAPPKPMNVSGATRLSCYL